MNFTRYLEEKLFIWLIMDSTCSELLIGNFETQMKDFYVLVDKVIFSK